MRFLVFLLFSWCPSSLGVKSLASLGLIKAGSKLAAFQKYTDNVVARFLKSDSSAVTDSQAQAMQTVKEYLKAMIWGDEGVWQWHLHDIGLTNTYSADCIKNVGQVRHVSLLCEERVEGGETVKRCRCNLEMGNLGRKDTWNGQNFDFGGAVANGTLNAHNYGAGVLTATNQAQNDTMSQHLQHARPSFDMAINGGPANYDWDGHKQGLTNDATNALDGTQITNNQVWTGGQEVKCENTLSDKHQNMRELRKLAELSYRRMHVCHNEKGQEFWLAGSQKDRSVTGTRIAVTPNDYGPGFCGLYKQYRGQNIDGLNRLWGNDNTFTGTMDISVAAYLHSFPSCASAEGIQYMAGNSNRHGVKLTGRGPYANPPSGNDGTHLYNEGGVTGHGDKRCVAFRADETSWDFLDHQQFVKLKTDGQDPDAPETIIPRTCEMYNENLVQTNGETGWAGEAGQNDIQCDTWFRDCLEPLGETRGESARGWATREEMGDTVAPDTGVSATDIAGDPGVTGNRYYHNTTHSTYTGCTQRKPLKSPLLQSCSYTANYNNYPPYGSTKDARGVNSDMYLEDKYVATHIVSVREDMETCLEEVRAWFDPMWTHYSLCRRGEEIGLDAELCQEEVREWEDAVCIFTGRLEEICDYIETCLDESSGKCGTQANDVAQRVKSRKVDYESTQRIECLLDAVSYLDEGCVCFGLCDNTQKQATYNLPTEGFDRTLPNNGVSLADGGQALYDFTNTGDGQYGNAIPKPEFDNVLKAATCQTEYERQKRNALDRCMILMESCRSDSAEWNDDGACPGGWLFDKALASESGADAQNFPDTPSLGWMRSDFRFPRLFVQPSHQTVVAPKCEDKFGMYACVNADFTADATDSVSANLVTSVDTGGLTGAARKEAIKVEVDAQHASLRLAHPCNVKEFVVGGPHMVYDPAVLVCKDSGGTPHLGEIADSASWIATVPTAALSDCGAGGSTGLTSSADGDVNACPGSDGKIHLDDGIWDLVASCEPGKRCCLPDELNKNTGGGPDFVPKDAEVCQWCEYTESPAPWECPQFNRCMTFRVNDYEEEEACKTSTPAGLACQAERQVNPRLFWQVPGTEATDTGSNGKANDECQGFWGSMCDASFQRMYYALTVGGPSRENECNQHGDQNSMHSNYVSDKAVWNGNVDRFPDDFFHLQCKQGADEHQFWKGVEGQTMSTFGDSSSTAKGAGKCSEYHGGPITIEIGQRTTYASRIAGWLKYGWNRDSRDGDAFPGEVHPHEGRTCFQRNPCPATKTLTTFHTVYPVVTCPTDGQPCNSGYYEDAQGTAYGEYSGGSNHQPRAYNPPTASDTYCVDI